MVLSSFSAIRKNQFDHILSGIEGFIIFIDDIEFIDGMHTDEMHLKCLK